jgi:hypothetical protein
MRTVLAGGLLIAALAPCPAAAARTSVAAALRGLERSGAITPEAHAQDMATYVAAQKALGPARCWKTCGRSPAAAG